MEFPDLGKHCADQSCKQLDFLPLRCDLCQKVYCKLHFAYASHSCPLAYKKDNLVPACPLCSRPIPVAAGEDANAVVGRHMDTDCSSEPAQRHRKRAGRCSATGCRTRELVPVTCPSCRLNFCIKHRLEQDHACAGFQGSGRAVSNAAAAAVARQQQQQPKEPQRQQQRRQSPSAAPAPNLREAQLGLSDQEALQMALRMSAADAPSSAAPGSAATAAADEQRRRQEELDRQLAESLQASERQQRQQQRGQQQSGTDGSGCAMS